MTVVAHLATARVGHRTAPAAVDRALPALPRRSPIPSRLKAGASSEESGERADAGRGGAALCGCDRLPAWTVSLQHTGRRGSTQPAHPPWPTPGVCYFA